MKKLIMLITILSVLTIGSLSQAEDNTFLDNHEVSIGYSFYTTHFSGDYRGDGRKYNNNNQIIVLSIDQWFASTFVNSHFNRSYSAGYTFRTPKWQPVGEDFYGRLTLKVGLVYGYDDDLFDIAGFTPGALPSVEIGYKKLSIDTGIIPIGSGVMTCVLKYTF